MTTFNKRRHSNYLLFNIVTILQKDRGRCTLCGDSVHARRAIFQVSFSLCFKVLPAKQTHKLLLYIIFITQTQIVNCLSKQNRFSMPQRKQEDISLHTYLHLVYNNVTFTHI